MLLEKSKITPSILGNWVMDLSSKELRPHEYKLLGQGLKYAVTTMQIPVEKLISSVENGIRNKSGPNIDLIRLKIAGVLANARCPESNLAQDLNHAIRTLHEWNDMIYLSVDKGQ